MTTCVAACRMCWKYVVKTELIVMCNRLQGDGRPKQISPAASLTTCHSVPPKLIQQCTAPTA
jgi:hypothetical protein